MNTCSIVGTVKKAKADTTKTGKTCAKVRVEVARTWQDKTFTTRFDVVVYGADSTTAAALNEGTIVWATGEVRAYTTESNGKTYANMEITGRIGTISKPDFAKVRQEFDRAPAAQQSLPMPRSAAPAPTAEPPIEDSEIPF